MISLLSVIQFINQHVYASLMAWRQNQVHLTKDRLNQAIALLEIIQGVDFQYDPQLKTARMVLIAISKVLQSKLKQQEVYPIPATIIDHSIVSEDENSLSNYIRTTTTKFSDIIGCDQAKQWLEENVILQFNATPDVRLQLFQGIRNGLGNVLLHGPPGTGKTLLAQATANECQAALIDLKPSDILSKYQGESEKFVDKIFKLAKSYEKAIIFLDEFDSIAKSRISGEDSAQSRRLLSELLLQLTNLKTPILQKRKLNEDSKTPRENRPKVVVIAATNRFEDIDEAVSRRFECKVHVAVPNACARKKLVMKFLKDIANDLTEDDLNFIANLTYGWSGSDIEVLCREAAMIPLREFRSSHSNNLVLISQDHSVQVLRSLTRSDFDLAHKAVVLEVPQEGSDNNI